MMQGDGNFVAYNAAGTAYWDTATHRNPGAWVLIQDDGNVVVYSHDNRALWASGGARFPAGAPIHAVSRSAGKLDIFGTDLTGRVFSGAWEPAFTDGRHGWWTIADGRALSGGPVKAGSDARLTLDIFVTGTDGRTWSAALDARLRWIVARLMADRIAEMLVKIRLAGKMNILKT